MRLGISASAAGCFGIEIVFLESLYLIAPPVWQKVQHQGKTRRRRLQTDLVIRRHADQISRTRAPIGGTNWLKLTAPTHAQSAMIGASFLSGRHYILRSKQ